MNANANKPPILQRIRKQDYGSAEPQTHFTVPKTLLKYTVSWALPNSSKLRSFIYNNDIKIRNMWNLSSFFVAFIQFKPVIPASCRLRLGHTNIISIILFVELDSSIDCVEFFPESCDPNISKNSRAMRHNVAIGLKARLSLFYALIGLACCLHGFMLTKQMR